MSRLVRFKIKFKIIFDTLFVSSTNKLKELTLKMKSIKKITGLTQEEMASYLGINRSLWSMYVSGKRTIRIY